MALVQHIQQRMNWGMPLECIMMEMEIIVIEIKKEVSWLQVYMVHTTVSLSGQA